MLLVTKKVVVCGALFLSPKTKRRLMFGRFVLSQLFQQREWSPSRLLTSLLLQPAKFKIMMLLWISEDFTESTVVQDWNWRIDSSNLDKVLQGKPKLQWFLSQMEHNISVRICILLNSKTEYLLWAVENFNKVHRKRKIIENWTYIILTEANFLNFLNKYHTRKFA